MFAKDSERGRLRGQSSWGGGGGDWSGFGKDSGYGRNQSHDSEDDFRRQSFGRGCDNEDSDSSKIVCQNYLQNKCMRGNNCLFLHPSPSGGSGPSPNLPSSSNSKRQRNPWLNFCLDFQRGQCPFSDECRLLHVSKRDEADYHSSGDIPAGSVEQAMSKAMVMDWAYIGNQPHCKDYLQGSCNMRGCSFRHLNTDQFVVEVLAALREKFMMHRDEMFPNDNRDSNFSPNKGDQYGMRQPSGPSKNIFADGGNGFEPDINRIRGMDFSAEDKRLNRLEDKWQGFSQGNDNFSQKSRAPPNEDYLDVLRRQNMNATKTNTEVKKTAHMLEEENAELRKALRLALDLNTHARSLQEFRSHLQELQASLRKRGYVSDSSMSDSGPWNNMEGPVSHQENRMGRERYSSDNNRDFDRMDMQYSSSSRFNSPW